MSILSPHLKLTFESHERLQQRNANGNLELDGTSLHVIDVVSTAYHGCVASLTGKTDVVQAMHDSVEVLMQHLEDGSYVYGVNTGFGGSADSRTDQVVALQAALMQLTQAGILGPVKAPDRLPDHAMPLPWVRATIVVRCNATVRGHSAVSLPILEALLGLLRNRVTPVVPLRGSVSASGDLMPLSYISGAIQGNPDILVQLHDEKSCEPRIMAACEALAITQITPVALGPKEGLGLVNGTASSAALGALAMHEAHRLALLTQALTGIAVEAMCGSGESFNKFIADVRPHPGQIECARNIRYLLSGSRLARDMDPLSKDRRREELIQDRYSLRSSPQWIGPYLEDLLLADRQVSIELNSSCDNPLVNVATKDILYGCNFQATSITSAMEKTRLATQNFGRLLFSQLSEMVDPSLNGGLPANLAADNPSLSFTMKGIDISMAAYMAELSFLASPLSAYSQTAEMHNQSINSMAFASARITMEAIDILSLMCACSLYAGCQALDLRALHLAFLQRLCDAVHPLNARFFSDHISENQMHNLNACMDHDMTKSWNSTSNLDLKVRCSIATESALHSILDALGSARGNTACSISGWRSQAAKVAFDTWEATSQEFADKQHTQELLGAGSRALYNAVRYEIGVPFHLGFAEHPTAEDHSMRGRRKRTVGGWASMIYVAIKSGKLYVPLMELIKANRLHE